MVCERFRSRTRRVESLAFSHTCSPCDAQTFIIMLIIFNTGLMMMERYPMPIWQAVASTPELNALLPSESCVLRARLTGTA